MFETVLYETPAPRVARIVLNRPASRNAQDTRLLYELNAAFDMAARDDEISVIILAANGPHFSSGHDLREADPIGSLAEHETVGTWCGFTCAGAEGWMAREKELYQGLTERWRNLPKPTIAQVQGKCIAGGLMLIWPCDLIVASEDATFADNTVSMGMTGVEYFGHPWELGPRKAKEMLFTSDFLSAQEAHRLHMVNHVVSAETLESFTLDLASRIAEKPLFALKLAKEAVNAAEDAQGRISAMQTAFALHQLGHSHNMQVHGMPIDPRGAGGLVAAKKP
ncbi:MAG: enoyl-CoA hydratase [Caulobacter sp.]|nr:enoyl-CoA hydratase [Caulobacter sp.]